MYAYCNNNPVSRKDNGGYISELVIAGAVAAVVSGIANAVNTAASGGTIEQCLIAGVAGMVGGAVGFVVAVATSFSPLGNVAARATTTIVSDLGTSLLLNGKITTDDLAYAAIDTTLDVCLSPIAYYYNPVEALVPQTAINAVADGIIDHAETELFFRPRPTSAEARNVQKLTFKERRLGG